MLVEGIKGDNEKSETKNLSLFVLLLQGLATSIDALSVGFTISEYGFIMALLCAIIIATVTFVTCFAGLGIGKKFGTKFSGRATILGGLILIFIGIEIFIEGVF
jgi:putative Mn2+ efflux pump MntP